METFVSLTMISCGDGRTSVSEKAQNIVYGE